MRQALTDHSYGGHHVRLLAILTTLFLTACGSSSSYNPTVFPYEYSPPPAGASIDTVVIATHNLGTPSRNYLESKEEVVDAEVIDYLRDHDIEILPASVYDAVYEQAVRTHGNPYDYTTGRTDPVTQQKVLYDTFVGLREQQPELDAIIFTDIIERQVTFSVGMKRVARFDGVSRGPRMQGPGQGVPADFNWAKLVDAASLAVYIFNMEGQRVFHSIGGMSLTESIDTKGTPKFARSRTILDSDSQIREGVEIAFHPWIPMKNYPGKK